MLACGICAFQAPQDKWHPAEDGKIVCPNCGVPRILMQSNEEEKEACRKALRPIFAAFMNRTIVTNDTSLMYMVRKAVEQHTGKAPLDGQIRIGPNARAMEPNSIAIGPNAMSQPHQMVLNISWMYALIHGTTELPE